MVKESEFNRSKTLIIGIIMGIIASTIVTMVVMFLFESLPLSILIGAILLFYLPYSIYKNAQKTIEKNK